jgi:PAS domain S-box-containing protein
LLLLELKELYKMINTTGSQLIHLAELLNDASIDRVMAIDTQWHILAWNKTSESVTGISKQEVLGKPLLEVFPQLLHDEEMLKAYRHALNGKKSFLEARAGLFNRVHYENHFIPLMEDRGPVIGVMNIMHDVAHRIKAEEELQKLNIALKEKYKELEKASGELATFTAITGTALKEPIRNVYTALEYLVTKEGQNLSFNGRANLRRIQASLNRMNLLLDDILAMSAASSFSDQYTLVNLEAVLQEALNNIQQKIKEREVDIESDPLPELRGSRQMLLYLIQNIIDYAIQLHKDGTMIAIKVTCSKLPATEDTGSAGRAKEYFCIAFTGKGINFEAAAREQLLPGSENIKNRKSLSGHGFTLTMCRKIAEAHGGYLETKTNSGKASGIYCYIDPGL